MERSLSTSPSLGSTDEERGLRLVRLARQTIEHALGGPDAAALRGAAYERPGATFVTLRTNGELRGCTGSLEAERPLAEDVVRNAMAAAFLDTRFEPLRLDELADLSVEVSLLSPLEPLACRSEADACERLRPGVDGVVLVHRGRRATFLPQVWEELPEPRAFLAQLKRKAGLAPDFWSDEVRLFTYAVQKWGEGKGERPARAPRA